MSSWKRHALVIDFRENSSLFDTSFGGWRGIIGCSLFRYSCSKIFVIPLFLLKNFRYSIIPAQKYSLFHYSSPKSTHYSIIPRTKLPLFLFHYSSSAPELARQFAFWGKIYSDTRMTDAARIVVNVVMPLHPVSGVPEWRIRLSRLLNFKAQTEARNWRVGKHTLLTFNFNFVTSMTF